MEDREAKEGNLGISQGLLAFEFRRSRQGAVLDCYLSGRSELVAKLLFLAAGTNGSSKLLGDSTWISQSTSRPA